MEHWHLASFRISGLQRLLELHERLGVAGPFKKEECYMHINLKLGQWSDRKSRTVLRSRLPKLSDLLMSFPERLKIV